MTRNDESVGSVVGRNARSLRQAAGVSLDDMAQVSPVFGVRWTTGRVGDIESGRSTPTLPTLLIYCAALTRLGGRDVRLADLFGGDGAVRLSDGLAVHTSALRRAVGGGAALTSDDAVVPAPSEVSVVGLADERAAKRLGLTVAELVVWSWQLWGATFGDERDRRAGPFANAQRKGQVTRALLTEIDTALREGRDNGDD